MQNRLSADALRRLAAGIVLPVCVAGCLQEGRGPGALSGPSTLALSIRLSAAPDVLPADGASRAVITVTSAGPDGAPVGNLRLAVRIVEDSIPHDVGRLSTRFVVTDAAGHAAFSYRAPAPDGGASGDVDRGRIVTLVVAPVADDFGGAVERRVRIRLVPAGAVIPPFDVQPGFEVTPASPSVFDQVRFSAAACRPAESATDCTRDPSGLIASFQWDFGDGRRAWGQQLSHAYSTAGTYFVRLSVTDSFGRSADATSTLTVAAGPPPDASFTVSPLPAAAGAEVFFDASPSTAAAGRRIVSYAWDFGDGSGGNGMSTRHVYGTASTYTVVLNVTDDAGRRGSTTATVEVVDAAPAAVVE